MKNEEAKFILQAYRPNGADAADPGLAEALAQARRDPAIERWFAAQQAFDRAVSAKLGEITPPPGLRDAILAGARFATGSGKQTSPLLPSALRRRETWPAWVGLAAGVALLLAVSLAVWPKSAEATPLLLDFALNDTLRQTHHGHQHSREAAEFQAWLGSTETRLTGGLAIDFEQLRRQGCRVIAFDGKPLLEICFQRDGVWFHAYIARATDFPQVTAPLPPLFRDEGRASAVAWSDGNHIYIVASKAGREALQRLI
jgi:hypothetical protein